ncbi:MAG: hypothetical protein K8S14_08420, partial [Actinomycetia bacterium]|nr:hypothetical protein [Actinomycetes bacterium]
MSAFYRLIVRMVVGWVVGGVVAAAQVQPIDNRVNMRVPDASNLVGSGGYNAPVRTSFNTGNMFITGNVTGGRAFRGFSPIRDPSSLLMNLPTSRLSNFQRDSIGVGDVLRGRSQATVSPFYLRSATATSAGGFGLGRPGITSSITANT